MGAQEWQKRSLFLRRPFVQNFFEELRQVVPE